MSWAERFRTYFDREVAQKAAHSLSDAAEIEIHVPSESGNPEIFTFTKSDKKNQIKEGPASDPQLQFTVPPAAAEMILNNPSEDIGAIGVSILKLVVSSNADHRISVRFKAGFITLFSKGYFGVLTAGGAQFASYLASRGLNGMGAIKAALKKMKG